MAGSSDIQIASNIIPTPVTKEFTFPALYLHHNYAGTNPNQLEIVAGRAGFGTTLVNSWEIYNGIGPEAQLVGHAQGLHISAKNWHNSFTIVFEAERLKESTLTVMGQSVVKEGEWAIVGGTGVFSMANGVIKRTLQRQRAEGDILELKIHGFTMILPIVVTKSELSGRKGKTQHDIKSTPLHLQSVTVRTSDRLNGLYFTYIDQVGKTHNEGLWGGGRGGPNDHLLKLDTSEYVMEVSGTIINNYVGSVTIVTNKQKFGPYGSKSTGSTFATTVPRGNVIVGFYATSTGPMINSLGVYSVPQDAASP